MPIIHCLLAVTFDILNNYATVLRSILSPNVLAGWLNNLQAAVLVKMYRVTFCDPALISK